jgi:hypothetical protein
MKKFNKTTIKKQPVAEATQTLMPQFKGKHLHIMIPCYAGMLYEVVMSSILQFLNIAPSMGLIVSLDTIGNESLITRGRNNLMARGLKNFPQATHFLFIDSDIRFQPNDIVNMLQADKEVIGGLYPKKGLPIDYNFNRKRNEQGWYGEIDGLVVEVETMATGFLMFKREVYEQLIEAYPETKYIDDIALGKQYEPFMYAIFDTVIDEQQRYLSEDWTFCRRWAGLNENNKIWADCRVLLGHCGTYLFMPKTDAELIEALKHKGLQLNPPEPATDTVIPADVIPEPQPQGDTNE